jgi:hypothetical protein
MGLLTGGLNGRRFRIPSPLPSQFREQFMEAIREHAIVPDTHACTDEPLAGWVHAFDPAETTFELNDFLFDRFLVLTLRIDKKTVSSKYFNIALTEKVAERAAERGEERLPKSELEALTDGLRSALLGRALPTVTTCDLAWDINSGEVIVFSTSEKVLERLEAILRDTFAVTLRPERMVDWLTEKIDREEVIERIHSFLPDARGGAGTAEIQDGWHPDDPLEGAEKGIAVDFLTWLWLQSDQTDGHFRIIESSGAQAAAHARLDNVDDQWNDITESLKQADLLLWVENRLKLARVGAEDQETTLIVGDAPTTSDAARHDVRAGKRPVEACLGLKIGELACKLTLLATPAGVEVKGLKIPFEVKQGTDEKVFERMMLLDLVHTSVKQLFQQFFLTRTSPAWADRVEQWRAPEQASMPVSSEPREREITAK